MEITNEIKSKVFAQYFNCMYSGDGYEMCLTGERIDNIQCGEQAKIILKPISEITDEDAIEIAVLAGMTRPMNRFEFVISRHINYTKRILSEYFEGYNPTEEIITGNVWLSLYQFLQSKGYDLPQHLLGGKTLKECNLAIYENEK